MVGQEHRLADRPCGVETARSIGEDDRRATRLDRCAHAVHDRGHRVTLVEVRSTTEDEHCGVADPYRSRQVAVAQHGRGREPRQVGQFDVGDDVTDLVGSRGPARPEDDSDVMSGDAGAIGDRVGGRGREFVWIAVGTAQDDPPRFVKGTITR